MTNQDESKDASNGEEGKMYIDLSGKDTNPDLDMDDTQETNPTETRLSGNDSQTSFEDGNGSGLDDEEKVGTPRNEGDVN